MRTKQIELITSLCEDIARHASQLEAKISGTEQSTDRYLELKTLLISHYLQGVDNFEVIIKELQKSIEDAGSLDDQGELTVAIKIHVLCMFEYFLMLTNEANKAEK